jgi:hypothetical protein
MSTNLPAPIIEDSAEATKLFFDQYGISPLEFSANEVSAAIGFFESKGFSDQAGTATAYTLLNQAKIDGVSVFKLLDTLKTFNGVELSAIVSEILNNNRRSTSTLGYRSLSISKTEVIRNISP